MDAGETIARLNVMKSKSAAEMLHCEADEALIVFLKGHDEECRQVAEAYLAARQRVGFWYA